MAWGAERKQLHIGCTSGKPTKQLVRVLRAAGTLRRLAKMQHVGPSPATATSACNIWHKTQQPPPPSQRWRDGRQSKQRESLSSSAVVVEAVAAFEVGRVGSGHALHAEGTLVVAVTVTAAGDAPISRRRALSQACPRSRQRLHALRCTHKISQQLSPRTFLKIRSKKKKFHISLLLGAAVAAASR